MVNAEVSITTGDRQIGFFQVSDFGHHRPGCQIVLEFIHGIAAPFGNHFDAAIGQISNRAEHLMPGGGAHRKEAVPNALHRSGNDEASCNHCEMRGNLHL